jgi:DNA-binding response OmpR family regulator
VYVSTRIVLVEDDPNQARILRLYLEREEYSVVVATTGSRALAAFREQDAALVILDLMLPDLDGRDVCRLIRAESDVPILMLTARSAEGDVMSGLDLGADDYVTKPYRPGELMARVRALVRRSRLRAEEPSVVEYADLVVAPDRRVVERAGAAVALTASEFDILLALASRPGRVHTRVQLLDLVVGYRGDSLERTIDAHVRNIRRKLGDDAASPRYIATVVGVGYKAP